MTLQETRLPRTVHSGIPGAGKTGHASAVGAIAAAATIEVRAAPGASPSPVAGLGTMAAMVGALTPLREDAGREVLRDGGAVMGEVPA